MSLRCQAPHDPWGTLAEEFGSAGHRMTVGRADDRGSAKSQPPLEPGQASLTRGEIAAEITTRLVQLVKEHADRGPTKCRTYIDDDLIIVMMLGGFSRLENALFEDGKWLDVRSTRHAFADTMEGRFTEVIERLTGREVAAFMSASHQQPDLQVEMFVLDDGGHPSPGDRTP